MNYQPLSIETGLFERIFGVPFSSTAGKVRVALICVFLGLMFTAGSCESATNADETLTDSQLQTYKQGGQDVPKFDWSQHRQTIIDIEKAQANTVATTTFFFNEGIQEPVKSCPSIGFPIASTTQLTNPQQWTSGGGNVAQMEPTGVFTGESSGTYVVCVTPAGIKYITYWEGNVHAEGGPAKWNPSTHLIELNGKPTVETGRK
jgi:hypothetical protein